ncbi:hypothetical protein [Kordia sp.]|uniref:hypothetical protein n=1 Tax=Kordia sp. TaxID=1965332 RepID=UPI003D2CCE05
MPTFVKKKKIANIIVYNTDRFPEQEKAPFIIRRIGINLIAVTQLANTKTSRGRFYQNT